MDLRNLPLDGFDMFLLAQLDSTSSVAELVDIAPCDRAETMRRLHQMARFQVVELSAETAEERTELARQREPAAQPGVREVGRAAEPAGTPTKGRLKEGAITARIQTRPRAEFDEESTTLRPPPQKVSKAQRSAELSRRTLSEDDAATLRPPAPVAVEEMMHATEDSTVRSVIDRSSGVVEKRVSIEFQTPREVVSADGQPVRDRSVFSRQTLVDEDSESRARQLEEPVPARRR